MYIDPENPERIFLFIDESGDPGSLESPDSSTFYQLNIVAVTRSSLKVISQHLSRFRYFQDAGKELKRYITPKFKKKLCELFEICSENPGIELGIFHITKKNYTGPYLEVGNEKFSHNPKRFSNFLIRRSLETFLKDILPRNNAGLFSKGLEIEVVFDRFLLNERDEQNLKDYLRKKSYLPSLSHITQVDSDYSDFVQFADYLGKLAKDVLVDTTHDCSLEYVSIYKLDNPDNVQKRKGP
ncbi:MAG: hypothetical protein JWN64_92 [Parcubacteria group bacterium]|nr:hypothetical protein [Parcubacteria group bacterium]